MDPNHQLSKRHHKGRGKSHHQIGTCHWFQPISRRQVLEYMWGPQLAWSTDGDTRAFAPMESFCKNVKDLRIPVVWTLSLALPKQALKRVFQFHYLHVCIHQGGNHQHNYAGTFSKMNFYESWSNVPLCQIHHIFLKVFQSVVSFKCMPCLSSGLGFTGTKRLETNAVDSWPYLDKILKYKTIYYQLKVLLCSLISIWARIITEIRRKKL